MYQQYLHVKYFISMDAQPVEYSRSVMEGIGTERNVFNFNLSLNLFSAQISDLSLNYLSNKTIPVKLDKDYIFLSVI